MQREGRIVKCVGGLYTVYFEDGSEAACKAKGAFRHENTKPVAGDRAIVKGDADDPSGISLTEICKRKNMFVRPPLANIDVIFVVMAAARPEPILTTFDKLICLAEYMNIEPVVIITKADLDPKRADELASIYKKSGFTVFKTDIVSESFKTELFDYIKREANDKLSCFAGASGVGKSTLMTSLFPELDLKTGEVSRKIGRGKQTTRHIELFPISRLIPGLDGSTGFIADTPGFSVLDFLRLDFFSKEDLALNFREFEKYIGKCRYTKCTHLCEEGCAICEAVRNGEIPKERHDSFVEIYNELKDKHDWSKHR